MDDTMVDAMAEGLLRQSETRWLGSKRAACTVTRGDSSAPRTDYGQIIDS